MKIKIYILFTLLTAVFGAWASDTVEEKSEFQIRFPINSARIYPNFGDNAKQLARLDSLLDAAAPDSIVLEGWASPDGPVALNMRLAKERRQAVRDYIVERHPGLAASISEGSSGIAWQELADMVAASDEPWAARVVSIITTYPASKRNASLKAINGGRVWRKLIDDYYQPLRATTASVYNTILVEPEIPVIEPVDTVSVIVEIETVEEIDTVVSLAPVKKNRYWSLTTNMLYDLLAVPNVGFDIYLGKNWSLNGNWSYAWWDKKPKARYWRTYGGWIGARRWFGSKAEEKPLQGHHLGIYAQVLLYDFEWGGKGYLSGIPGRNIFHRPTWGGGIEYGYSLPVGRHLNIDFNIGVGYLTGQYREYEPHDDHFVWLRTKNRRYFGPTKAEITLVWLLGHGNVNPKKGGQK